MRCRVEAAAWLVRLAEAGEETTAGFESWLGADPRNAAAWQKVQSPWALLGEMENAPEVIEARHAALGHATAAARTRADARPARSRLVSLRAIAATLLVIAVGALLSWNLTRPDIYQTAKGERRVIMLDDGSQLALDADSEVRVAFGRTHRDLRLIRGQARFTVAHDVERPFSVVAAGRKVVATGTMFNVDMLAADLFVTLLEGRVIVLPGESPFPAATEAAASPGGDAAARAGIELRAGNQLVVTSTAPPSIRSVDLSLASAWESGRLVFENEPLSSVAARVSRYSERTVRVADARTAELRISGVFNAGDTDGFLATIASYLPVRAMTGTNGTIVLRRS